MPHESHQRKKSSLDLIELMVYISVYTIMTFYQKKLESYEGVGTILQGISIQLQSLLSAFTVVTVQRYGYYVAVALNILGSVRLISVIATNHYSYAVTGLISVIATIILISMIHIFYQKIIKNNDELILTNRQLKEKDKKLTYLAYYDVLTGLPNRQLFIERIDEAINSNSTTPFTVISANIDNFKNINNEHGNNAGDAVLCSFSKKLQLFCKNSMFLARINGDEFGIIVYGKESEITVLNYVEALREIIAEPVIFQNIKLFVTMSFGIASYPLNASNSTEILKCVNSALCFSKSHGKNKHYFYSQI